MSNLIFPQPVAPAGSWTYPITKEPFYSTIIQTPASQRGELRIGLMPYPRWSFAYDFSYLRGYLGNPGGTNATNTVAFSTGNSIVFTATEAYSTTSPPDYAAPNGVTSLVFVANSGRGVADFTEGAGSAIYSGGTASGSTIGNFFVGNPPGMSYPGAFNLTANQWQASTAYEGGAVIYDPTSQTVQVVTTPGTSGSSKPTFSTTAGNPSSPSPDGGVVWASNGVISTNTETIYVNVYDETNTARTLNGLVDLFNSLRPFSSAAGFVATLVGGDGTTNATPQAQSYFGGGTNITNITALQNLIGFYMAVQGPFQDWLFQDPFDSTIDVTQGCFCNPFIPNVQVVGDGASVTFQLVRQINGGFDIIQNIDPSGTTVIYVDGVPNFAWSYTGAPGQITFDTAPLTGAVLTWSTTSFFYRCRFDDDSLKGLIQKNPNLWELPSLKFTSVIL